MMIKEIRCSKKQKDSATDLVLVPVADSCRRSAPARYSTFSYVIL